jgi:hypothetical protein
MLVLLLSQVIPCQLSIFPPTPSLLPSKSAYIQEKTFSEFPFPRPVPRGEGVKFPVPRPNMGRGLPARVWWCPRITIM